MIESGFPLLSLLILTLPLGAALIWLTPNANKARWIALGTALVDLALAIIVVLKFDTGKAGFQLIEQASWIPTLNINYKVGVDGISVLFLPVTIIVFIGIMLSSWNAMRTMPRLYYSLLLLLESTTLGIFCALDTILFFLFWELTLIPIYFLISLWGIGPHRRYAAVKYSLFMLAGGVPLLFGFILLAFNYANINVDAGLSFDFINLLNTPVSMELQGVIFFLLLVGFAVKTPVFPLHTWLPTVAMEGPASITAYMTGLKLGAFGLIRFLVPLTPGAAQEYHWLIAGLGVTGILYGAYAALAQTNLRRMLAFSSVSHVGLVLLGISSFNMQGIQGAVFHLLNFTIVAGGLFLLTGILHHRAGSTDLVSLGGVARTMPLLTTFFFLFGLASMGVPGTNGFIAELLILISSLQSHTGAGLAALAGIVVGAAYFLSYYRRAFLGPVKNSVIEEATDLRRREITLFTVLAFVILFTGFYPQAILDVTQVASENWLGRLK